MGCQANQLPPDNEKSHSPDCLSSHTQNQSNGLAAGRWTESEHERFLTALQIYGKDWKKLHEYITTREDGQIRSHAQKYLKKISKPIKKTQKKRDLRDILQLNLRCMKKEDKIRLRLLKQD